AWGAVQESQKDSDLQIYLPREVTIEEDYLKLGQVSIIRGEESLVAKASEITLGRLSVPGQKIVVDRPTVLSRLACNGIPARKVTLTGAEKITVKKQHQVIKGSEFVEMASSFLRNNLPEGSVCQLDPLWIPKDLNIGGLSKDVRLYPRLVKSSARNQAKVQIAVFADGKEVAVREVTFRLKYNHRTVVTLVEIPAGAVISPENVKIEKIVSNYPEPAIWRPPYGLIVRRRLPANTVIRPDMVGPVEPAVVVERNETVVIQIERPAFLVTALGKTMQKGQAGEYIKVRNLDSQRIILAKVNEDGTVEPIF
ncbi:MAG: flagellar basal body P-ring formation chaperone FlgA, partial [Phycisphaerae bacterium]